MADKAKAEETVATDKTKAADKVSTEKEESTEESQPLKVMEPAVTKMEPVTIDDETQEETEESEESDETEETESESENDLSQFLAPKTEKKDNVQRRIDRLVAERESLREENTLLKSQKEEKAPTDKDPEYTVAQLKQAYRKAIEDGDHELMWEIQNYRDKALEKKLRSEYAADQKKVTEDSKHTRTEWIQVVSAYDYLADPDEDEIYPGSRDELNIKDNKSFLYRISNWLYAGQPTSEGKTQENIFQYYHKPGGMKLAVGDALGMILKKRRGLKIDDKEKKVLRRKVTNLKKKKSLTSGSSAVKAESKPSKASTSTDVLNEYLKERKVGQMKMMG